MVKINDLSLCVATPNGSGSASSNRVLFQSIFKMGIPCSSKNMFPSNIQGMPTWYQIRASQDGYLCRADEIDLIVCFNPETEIDDVEKVRDGGIIFFDSTKEWELEGKRENVQYIGVPAEKLVKENIKGSSIRAKLRNMVYVGSLAALFEIPMDTVHGVLQRIFGSKPEVVENNKIAIQLGFDYIQDKGITQEVATLKTIEGGNEGLILTEGNNTAALGCIWGGLTVMAWYPITPSSSLAEGVEQYLPHYRQDDDGKNLYCVVQAEDEIAAAGMILGAGWAGARAMTCTSGPGLSLMNEMVGLSYFGEIPTNFFIVQRGGPSTGLPTRVQQSDITSMYYCSHGDTRHIVLLPHDMQSCFDFASLSFDLSDQVQGPVFFASDLDLGMNLWPSEPLEAPTEPMNRGKVLSEKELEMRNGLFHRFLDEEGDGVGYRTLPGNQADGAAYFTSGALQGESGRRSEKPEVYEQTLDRILKKVDLMREKLPLPDIEEADGNRVGIISFGSSVEAVREARDRMKAQGLETSHLLLKALPASIRVKDFIDRHELVFIMEQNRDGQVAQIFRAEWPELAYKIHKILNYDGLPVTAGAVVQKTLSQLKELGYES